jgi:hypothetical protein
MVGIRKFSLRYDVGEDRIALDTEGEDGATSRLWLTQRFCRGLVQALVPVLEGTATAARVEHRSAVQAFEQAAAIAGFGKVEPVRPRPQTPVGLVKGAEIRPGPDRIAISFDLGQDRPFVLSAERPAIRQMLFVLRGLYKVAHWPAQFWPDWVAEPAAAAPTGSVN